jgi:membrane protein YqaA with SNARE-associated domain
MLSGAGTAAFSGAELRRLLLRWCLGVGALIAITIVIATSFREPLTAIGNGFVARFGLLGMAVGTFVADGFQFPVPPQFYMFVSVATQTPALPTLLAISAGSLTGGAVAFAIAEYVGRIRVVAEKLARSRASVERGLARFGYWAPVIASLLPIAYSLLCYVAGANRLPWRIFFVLSACRIPRLILFYYLIRIGWLAA